jgi:hypothetical protein
MSQTEHSLLSGFLHLNTSKLQLKMVSIQIFPPKVWMDCDSIVHQKFVPPGQLNSINTGRFCNICSSKSDRNIRKDGRTTTDWSTMTIYLCTMLCQCSHFWLLRTSLSSPTLLSGLIYPLVISALFLRVKMQLWGQCWQDVPEIHKQLLTAPHEIPEI